MDPKRSAPPSEDQFLEQMSRELAGWSDPLERLNQALERDELQLFCQPILRLRPPRKFVMAEVLVRLREEEALMLPPGDFLPVFEHFGMMPELDRWVVSRGCAGWPACRRRLSQQRQHLGADRRRGVSCFAARCARRRFRLPR
jgi:predicted signal transduction protein with EAL and GGDEF domain